MRRYDGRDGDGDGEPAVEAVAPARSAVARALWLVAGLVLLGVGIAGVILPLLPGTVFLIAAAACFARSSPRLEAWLLRQPHVGPTIVAWRRHRVIPRKAKAMAFAGMAVSIPLTVLAGAPPIAIGAMIVVVAASALFVATRPSEPDR